MAKLVSGLHVLYFILTVTIYDKLLDDMSTWRGGLKKTALNIARTFYDLQSSSGGGDLIAQAERTATTFLHKSMFLRGGVDKNVSPYFLAKHSDCF